MEQEDKSLHNEDNETVDTVDEEELIVYGEEDVTEGVQNCQTSIIGKIIIDKNINLTWIQTAMSNIWKSPEGFRVTEVRPKMDQFFFKRESDLEKALEGSPWLFRNA
ncbi:hypothetical protein HN873_052542 [Arachis hypogaea]